MTNSRKIISNQTARSVVQNISSMTKVKLGSVNSEIFARVLFSKYMRSFVKIRPSRNDEITLSFTYIGKPYLCCEF